MNTFLSVEAATALHRELISRGENARQVNEAWRHRRARRLVDRAAELTRRAADLVELTHR